MIDKETLCRKIIEVFPDIGACGIDVNVDYSQENKAWEVHLKKGSHELKTYLEDQEADQCMAGKQCVSLGLQIAQLKENIEKL